MERGKKIDIYIVVSGNFIEYFALRLLKLLLNWKLEYREIREILRSISDLSLVFDSEIDSHL